MTDESYRNRILCTVHVDVGLHLSQEHFVCNNNYRFDTILSAPLDKMNDYQGLAVTSGDLCTAGFMLIGVQLSSNQGLVRIVDKLRAGRCCHL